MLRAREIVVPFAGATTERSGAADTAAANKIVRRADR
jgi:hypothetical protein